MSAAASTSAAAAAAAAPCDSREESDRVRADDNGCAADAVRAESGAGSAAAAASAATDQSSRQLPCTLSPRAPAEAAAGGAVQTFVGAFDDEGVWFYQNFNDEIADYAVKHQRLGGPAFNARRMTWIKPSFAWALYRGGYASKPNQTRMLRIKLPHAAVAEILSQCTCTHNGGAGNSSSGSGSGGGGGGIGRVQWDPARDLAQPEGRKPASRQPRRMARQRAIQIGIKAQLSEFYVASICAIEDVTDLARRVGAAHRSPTQQGIDEAMAELQLELPREEAYVPHCPAKVLRQLGMLPGPVADELARLGLGMAELVPGTAQGAAAASAGRRRGGRAHAPADQK